jgi:microcystin degradation protein MlrC
MGAHDSEAGVELMSAKRIAIGGLLFEGNTLSKVRTEFIDFQNKYLVAGHDMISALANTNVEVAGAICAVDSAGFEVIPLMATHGGAGGRVTSDCYSELKKMLLDSLRSAGKVDGVYLALHGAMICENEDDAEGDILSSVRSLIGDIPLSVSCDMHAHITTRMIEACSILIGYQHYPHDDTFETGARAAGLLVRAVKGEITPTTRACKVALLSAPVSHGTRDDGPMRQIYRWCRGVEASGRVLTLSYFPVQPWLDIEDTGFAGVAVTDNSPEAAAEAALDLVKLAWTKRHEFEAPGVDAQVALEGGLAIQGQPVVLSDASDCAGAGAAGDSSRMLGAYLQSGIEAPLLIHIVDPEIVEAAWSVGVGGTVTGYLGNKIDDSYGVPLPIVGMVTRLFEGDFTYAGGLLGGVRASMGRGAALAIRNAVACVSSHSAYEYGDEHFRAAGQDVGKFKFVVVKNPMNFKQAYAWAPQRLLVNLQGASTSDLRSVAWRRVQRPFYPLDDQEIPIFRALGP